MGWWGGGYLQSYLYPLIYITAFPTNIFFQFYTDGPLTLMVPRILASEYTANSTLQNAILLVLLHTTLYYILYDIIYIIYYTVYIL